MIGIIRQNVFEFRDESELAKALDWFADKYGCNTLIISDRNDYIKGVVYNGDFTFAPSINEEEPYYLYGTPQSIGNDLNKNEYKPVGASNWEIGGLPFKYINQRVPKPLDI